MRIIHRVIAGLMLASAVISPSVPASAQVMPVFITGSTTQAQTQWYRYQQYINEASSASSDYQQFLAAYKNLKQYGIGGLVNVVQPLMNFQNDIQKAMNNGTNPGLAAELQRNTIVLQNLALLDKLRTMNEGAGGAAQYAQVTNSILATMAADSAAQHQVDYAKTQAQIQAQNNYAALHAANNASTVQP